MREQPLRRSAKGPCDAAGCARAGLGRWPLVLHRRDNPGLLYLAAKPIPIPLARGDPQAPALSTLMK